MASCFRPVSFIFIVITVLFLANAVNSIPAGEFDSMLDTLRIRGYGLFCNAIVTSDLQFELLFSQNDTEDHRSFTFFAPIDSYLFALDMTQTAASYTDTLRFHVVPRRLSISDLLRLPAGSSLPTLLPHRYLNVTRSPDFGSVAISGVNIAFPGLFYGRDVAVHGLAGIISLRSNAPPTVVSGSPVGSSGRRSFPPRTSPRSPENYQVMAPSPSARPVPSPTPMFSSFNVSSRADSPAPVENILPVNRKAHAPAREPADANSHSHAASSFNRPVHPPEPNQLGSLVNQRIHAPEGSHSLARSPAIHGISPASSSESPANIYVLPPAVSHAFTPSSESREYRHAASPFNRAVHPPEAGESDSFVNQMTHAPKHSHSLTRSPVIHGISPASSAESPANIYVLPPGVSHASTPASELPEYRHSSISAPPLEYSDAAVPTAMSPDVWLPDKHGVTLVGTFTSGSEGLKNGAFFRRSAGDAAAVD